MEGQNGPHGGSIKNRLGNGRGARISAAPLRAIVTRGGAPPIAPFPRSSAQNQGNKLLLRALRSHVRAASRVGSRHARQSVRSGLGPDRASYGRPPTRSPRRSRPAVSPALGVGRAAVRRPGRAGTLLPRAGRYAAVRALPACAARAGGFGRARGTAAPDPAADGARPGGSAAPVRSRPPAAARRLRPRDHGTAPSAARASRRRRSALPERAARSAPAWHPRAVLPVGRVGQRALPHAGVACPAVCRGAMHHTGRGAQPARGVEPRRLPAGSDADSGARRRLCVGRNRRHDDRAPRGRARPSGLAAAMP